MAVAKRQGRSKEGPRTIVKTSGEANSLPGWPVYRGQAQGEEKRTYKKRSQN